VSEAFPATEHLRGIVLAGSAGHDPERTGGVVLVEVRPPAVRTVLGKALKALFPSSNSGKVWYAPMAPRPGGRIHELIHISRRAVITAAALRSQWAKHCVLQNSCGGGPRRECKP
jgi:hypothetical protein